MSNLLVPYSRKTTLLNDIFDEIDAYSLVPRIRLECTGMVQIWRKIGYFDMGESIGESINSIWYYKRIQYHVTAP